MSRNSKNTRKLRAKKEFKRATSRGGVVTKLSSKGPAKTNAVHGKVKTWYNKIGLPAPTPKTQKADDNNVEE